MRIRNIVLIAILALATPATADQTAAEKTCRDDALDTAARLTGCTAFVAEAGDDIDKRARALVCQAQAERAGEAYDKALATVGAALALRPDDDFALGENGVILAKLGRHDEALAVFDRLIELEPDDPWNRYYRGVILYDNRDMDGAVAAYDAALAIDPDYYWALRGRARVFHYTGPMIAAAESYARAADVRPLDSGNARSAGFTFDQAGMADRAAYFFRISLTLDPNQPEMRQWLDSYVGAPPAPALAALPWRPPPLDRRIRYLRVHTPVDSRDEMEISIDELFAFFGGSPRPSPLGSQVFEAWIAGIDADTLDWRRQTTATGGRHIPAEPPAGMFRGIFANTYLPLGPKAPPVVARFEGASPADIWPLEVGKAASGEGTLRTVCPELPSVPAAMLGCVEGIDATRRGKLAWRLAVERSERVQVPMGTFDTFVLHYTQTGAIALLLGKPNPVNQDVWLWYAPDLDTFVRREVMLGESYILDQAMALVGDGE